nr:phenylalanine--tRNA ligase subunit beta [Desulfonema limicola]
MRGQTSEGMLCSEKELELGTASSGIMELDPGLMPGTKLVKVLNLSDAVIEIDLTPNRPDCLSLIGVAREIGAMEKKKVSYPQIHLPETRGNISELSSVIIEAPDHCPRYAAQLIEGITIAPSPFWLQNRLLSAGLRPINNIVDITNFVMMETGQPLHGFDFDNLEENRIVVRTASDGERFTTLDGKERILSSDMLMICDGKKPVAIAGVMGGLNSEIENKTTRVLIESAYFEPASVRNTSKKLGLKTDASHRFERGVDPDGTIAALNRAALLMAEIGGGTLIGGLIDEHPVIIKNSPVSMSVNSVNSRLGINLSQDEMADLLSSIEFDVQKTNSDYLKVVPPSFRVDISRAEDLSEEVARLWGYDNIPVTFPSMPSEPARWSKGFEVRNQIKDIMCRFGFAEVINYSFISPSFCDKLQIKIGDIRRRLLNILNPLTEDQAVMRTTMIPGLLETMGRNLSKQNRNLKFFEIGKVFFSKGQDVQPDEVEMLAALWTGLRNESSWHEKEAVCDFYDLKGAAEGLLDILGIKNPVFTAYEDQDCDCTIPGRTAGIVIQGTIIGFIGEVHPNTLESYGLKQNAFIFELNVDILKNLISDDKQAQALPKYPSISRDITIIVNKNIEAVSLINSVRNMDEQLVEDIFLFDVYEGENIPQESKSISFRIVYRSSQETLEDEAVTFVHKKISEMLLKEYNASFPA